MCGYLILKKGADFVDKIQQDMIRGDNDSGTGSLPNSHTNSSEESDPEQNPGPMGGGRVPNSQGPDEDRKRNSKPDKVQVETGSVRASQPKTPKGSRKEKKVQPELSKEEILEENRRLKEERLCKICLDNEKEVIFIPCGHFAACASCGTSFSKCPVCRSNITSIVKTFSP